MRTAIVLLTRDLRVHDNPALSTAAHEAERIVPLFVFDNAIRGSASRAPNRVAFLLDALRDLDASLTARGARLVLRSGDVAAETLALARDVAACGSVRRRGRKRLRATAAAAPRGGVPPRPHRPCASRRVSRSLRSPRSRRTRAITTASSRRSTGPGRALRGGRSSLRRGGWRCRPAFRGAGCRLSAGSSTAAPSPELPPGGETHGRQRLSAWLRSGIARLRRQSRRPRGRRDLTPVAVPPLRLPLAARSRASRRRDRRSSALRPPARLARLLPPAARRETRDDARRHASPRPTLERRRDALEAWKNGETGYPIVDAGMRQLMREGYMHNRARLITASFLVRDLRIDWRAGARHYLRLARRRRRRQQRRQLAVGRRHGSEPPSQRRAFNPLRQARRFDPDGAYVRRYVTELAAIEGSAVHEPWKLRERSRTDIRPRSSIRPDMHSRFPFRFDPAYRRLARPFGVTPERAWVEVGEEEFEARYGPWRVRTPMSNIAVGRGDRTVFVPQDRGTRATRDHRPRPDVRVERRPRRVHHLPVACSRHRSLRPNSSSRTHGDRARRRRPHRSAGSP